MTNHASKRYMMFHMGVTKCRNTNMHHGQQFTIGFSLKG